MLLIQVSSVPALQAIRAWTISVVKEEKQNSHFKEDCATIYLSRIPTNDSTESRLGWTKIQQMYENVHPNLALELLLERTEVECGKGLFSYLQ